MPPARGARFPLGAAYSPFTAFPFSIWSRLLHYGREHTVGVYSPPQTAVVEVTMSTQPLHPGNALPPPPPTGPSGPNGHSGLVQIGSISSIESIIQARLAEERLRLMKEAGLQLQKKEVHHFKRPAERLFTADQRDRTTILFGGLTWKQDRKSTRLNSSHIQKSRMPSSA